ncbi:MAG: DUF2764 family protein [Marinifilaceae bacterium]
MFKNNYYCLIAGLPDLIADDNKVPFMISDFREELLLYLSKGDLKLIDLFFLQEDNKTLLSLLHKGEAELSIVANFSPSYIEERLKEPKDLPSYMIEFINNNQSEKKKYDVSDENELTWMFFDYARKSKSKFIRDFFTFEMNLRNLTTALNCRKYDRELQKEIIGNNKFAEALRTSKLKDFGLSDDFPFVERVLSFFDNPAMIEKEKQLDLLRWDFLDEKTTFEYFSIDKVLSFLIRLLLIERWSKLDTESGKKVFNGLITRLRNSLEFSKEFAI